MATEADVRQRAIDLVAQQYDPEVRQVRSNLGNLEWTLGRDVSTQKGLGQSGDKVIQSAFDRLGGQLQQGVGDTKNIYNQGATSVGAGFDQASKHNSTALDRVLGEVNSRL